MREIAETVKVKDWTDQKAKSRVWSCWNLPIEEQAAFQLRKRIGLKSWRDGNKDKPKG